eukprot:gene17781-24156_t
MRASLMRQSWRFAKKGCLYNASAADVLDFFGSIILPRGMHLYHQRCFMRDAVDDWYMKCSGSGFFSLSSVERLPCWRYTLEEPLILPVTYRFAHALNRLIDVLPEFVYALMPPNFVLAQGHFEMEGRGQTHALSTTAHLCFFPEFGRTTDILPFSVISI